MPPEVKLAAWIVVMVMGLVAPCQSHPGPPPGLSMQEIFDAFDKSDSNHVGFGKPDKPVPDPATTLPPRHHVPLNTNFAIVTTQLTPLHTTFNTTELDTPKHITITPQPTTTAQLDTPQYTATTPQPTTTAELDMPQHTATTPQPTTTAELDMPQHTATTPQPTTTAEVDTPQHTATTPQPTTPEETASATEATLPRHTATTTQPTTAAWVGVLLVVPVCVIPFLVAVVIRVVVAVKQNRSTPSMHTVIHSTENDEMNADKEMKGGTGDYKKKVVEMKGGTGDYKKKVVEILGRSVHGGGRRTKKCSRQASDCSVIREEGDNLV